MIIKVISLLLLLGICTANAATYHMPGDFTDLHDAFIGMQGGDTLIVRDGTYTGDENVIDHTHHPPNGSENDFTLIMAENVGNAIFDGENSRAMMNLQGGGVAGNFTCIQFEGIMWCNSPYSLVNMSSVDHIKLLRCSVYDAGGSGQGYDGFEADHCSYILFEDCWSYGAGRKHFYIGKFAEKVVVRRCVARHDRHFLYNDQESFMAYDSREVEFQNCISIDGDQGNFYTGGSGNPINPNSFLTRNTSDGFTLDDVYFRGCMSIANKDMVGMGGSNDCGVDYIDCVHWDSHRGSRMRGAGSSFNHCTLGDIDGTTTWSVGAYLEAHDPITNSIVYGVINYYGIWNASGNDYNCLYNNQTNYRAATAGQHSLCLENGNEIDPLTGTPGNGIAALEYLVRIEDYSDLDGTASDGNDRGATILYRIGESGTLWGEAGYNSVTDEPLWPFPNEDLIRDRMQVYLYVDPTSGDTLHGDRGFCKDTLQLNGVDERTLTSYIWEYLGNQMPDNVGIEIETESSNPPDNPYCICTGLDYVTFNNLKPGDEIGIYDMTGRLVHRSGQIPEDSYVWHLHNISTGIYLYRIEGVSTIGGKLLLIR
jgi:hypothetical protein